MAAAGQRLGETLVVIVEGGGRRFGLVVDEMLSQAQLVTKGLGDALRHSNLFSGAAILADGRVGLILSIDALAQELAPRDRPREAMGPPPAARMPQSPSAAAT